MNYALFLTKNWRTFYNTDGKRGVMRIALNKVLIFQVIAFDSETKDCHRTKMPVYIYI